MRTATGHYARSCSGHPQTRRNSRMTKLHSTEDCPPFPEVSGIEFRHVPGHLGYTAGSDGKIWCCRPWSGVGTHLQWRPLRGSLCKTMGFRLAVAVSGAVLGVRGQRTIPVSTLICIAFHGPRPDGKEVCHGDGNPVNDIPSNLRWGTRSENIQDAVKHGTIHRFTIEERLRGERCWNAKLTDAEVEMIIYLRRYLTGKDIAKLYNVSRSLVSLIHNNKRRYHANSGNRSSS